MAIIVITKFVKTTVYIGKLYIINVIIYTDIESIIPIIACFVKDLNTSLFLDFVR